GCQRPASSTRAGTSAEDLLAGCCLPAAARSGWHKLYRLQEQARRQAAVPGPPFLRATGTVGCTGLAGASRGGTRVSGWPALALEQQPLRVFEQLLDPHQEQHCLLAVDHAVVRSEERR